MCFVLQARPMKIAMKQLFYTAGRPPAIFLSLLPAPQQAIMSLDYGKAVEDLYGSGGGSGTKGGGGRTIKVDDSEKENRFDDRDSFIERDEFDDDAKDDVSSDYHYDDDDDNDDEDESQYDE